MCFLRSSAVLLVAAAFAAASPVFSGNFDDDNSLGGYSSGLGGMTGGYLGGNYGSGSNSYNAQRTGAVARTSNSGYGFDASRGYGSGFDNHGNDFSGSSSASSRANGNGMSGFTAVSGNGFNGVSGNGFNGVGTFSSVPGVLFAFPSLTSVSYSRVPQQDNDLATLAVLSALIADIENNNDHNDHNDAAAVQTVSHQTHTDTAARANNHNQGSKVAFVPVVAVPTAAKNPKTTKIVKTTIETDGTVSSIPELSGDLVDIAARSSSDSFDADARSSMNGIRSRSYSGASSSSGASSRVF